MRKIFLLIIVMILLTSCYPSNQVLYGKMIDMYSEDENYISLCGVIIAYSDNIATIECEECRISSTSRSITVWRVRSALPPRCISLQATTYTTISVSSPTIRSRSARRLWSITSSCFPKIKTISSRRLSKYF